MIEWPIQSNFLGPIGQGVNGSPHTPYWEPRARGGTVINGQTTHCLGTQVRVGDN